MCIDFGSLSLLILHQRPVAEHKDLIRIVEQQAHDMEADNMAKTIAEVLIESDFVKDFAENVVERMEPSIEDCVKQCIEHGKMLAKQEYIIQLLYSRFRAIPDHVRNKIQSIHDNTRLDTIFNMALTAKTIDEINMQIADS